MEDNILMHATPFWVFNLSHPLPIEINQVVSGEAKSFRKTGGHLLLIVQVMHLKAFCVITQLIKIKRMVGDAVQ